MDGLPAGYDEWKLASPPESGEPPEDDGSVCPECHGDDECTCDFSCCECGEELGETGACTNELCAEYDSEEEET